MIAEDIAEQMARTDESTLDVFAATQSPHCYSY